MPDQRLNYDKLSKYSNKVLLGKWNEDRFEYKRNNFKHNTTYLEHFPEQPYCRNDPNIVLEADLKQKGTIFSMDNEIKNSYTDNLSTLYDLSFNHFPKIYCGSIERKLRSRLAYFEPRDDYLQSFGNITSYGILEFQRKQWLRDMEHPKISHYRECFVSPKKEDYPSKRWATPLRNSTVMDPVNNLYQRMKFRDGLMFSVTPNQDLIVTKRGPPPCNPITWECPKC